jgi:hypothetical protein
MTLFKKEPAKKTPAKPRAVSLMDKLKKATEEATIEWLNKTFSYSYRTPVFNVEKVKSYIQSELEDKVESMILNACGLEKESFDRGWKVSYKGPLYAVITKVAEADAAKAVEKWAAVHVKKLPSALPDKYIKAIEKQYEESYMGAAISAAKELAEAKAQEDIDAILKGVLK